MGGAMKFEAPQTSDRDDYSSALLPSDDEVCADVEAIGGRARMREIARAAYEKERGEARRRFAYMIR